MTTQEIANKLRLLLDGDDGSVEAAKKLTDLVQRAERFRRAREHVRYVKRVQRGLPPSAELAPEDYDMIVNAYREPAPIRPWPEIVEACRLRGVFLWVEPVNEWARGYEVVCRYPNRILRTQSSYADLQDTISLFAIEALEAMK